MISQFSATVARLLLVTCWLGLAASPALAQTPAAPPPAADAPANSTGQTMEVTLAPRPVIAFAGTAEWDDGLSTVLKSFDKLRDEMGKAGLQAGGRPLAVFTETDDKGFRYDAMIPLTAEPQSPPQLGEGVRLTTSPAGRTMKFEHRGSYEDVDSTYEAITAYLDEKGLEAQNLFIEEYLNTPKGPDDPSLELDIYVFLR
jgi:effector-binding domain-containing protein